jgi:uncharacterized protein YceH (UPF0502 family)
MLVQLSPTQARVIGVLIEKEITTPDQYPLSLNALTLGCNQKSSREPILHLSETEVQNVLDELRGKNLLFEHQSSGSRVVKFKHRFCNTEFSSLQFSPQQLAIVCVLLLRGPQTPGELRTRTNRLAQFSNVNEVESELVKLGEFNGDKLVLKLAREAGKREARYAHLFSGESGLAQTDIGVTTKSMHDSGVYKVNDESPENQLTEALLRIEALEDQVIKMNVIINEMQENIDILAS